MQVFYAPDISGKHYFLDENESRHIVKVLRMTRGTSVRLIDGKGNLYEGIIENADTKKCGIEILSVKKNFETRDYYLHIGISPLKNTDRFEWFIEKSVEIGIDEITPVICRNTEKPRIRIDRIESLIVAAMKQSLKTTGTTLNKSCAISEFLRNDHPGTRMIAHCNDSISRQGIEEIYSKKERATILIGPEGDFDKDEIGMAIEKNFQSIHLGTSRLRAETAGIAACHSIYFMNQHK